MNKYHEHNIMNTTNEKKNNGSGVDVNSHAAKNNNNMDSNFTSTKTKVEKINPTMSSDHQKHVVATNHGGSITSSNSGGVSVKFSLPAVVACVEPRMGASSLNENHSGISATTSRCIKSSTANNLSGAASASSGSLSSSSGGSGNKKAPSGSLLKRPPQSLQKQNKFSQSSGTSNISNSGEDDVEAKIGGNTGMSNKNNNNDRSSGSGSGSGSGSDNNGGATTSSGTAAAVTASATSTANNNTTSSGSGDGSDRSSSGSGAGEGSGSGSGSGPGEYYYAGYGTATSMGGGTASSNNHQAASTKQGPNGGAAAQQPQQAMGMDASSNMPSFSNFQGAQLAASSAAADAGPQVQQQHHRQQQARGGQLAPPPMNSSTRHVVVGTDEGGLPPPPHAFTSHLRHHHHHHSRHHRHATGNNNEGNQHSAALRSLAAPPALSSGIPSAIGGPGYRSGTHHHAQQQRYELRLPPSDEQAVSQRVPRTHATVVAHDLPPPPTSSDAWSSTGSGGSASKSRKRSAAATAHEASHHRNSSGHPMVASVRLADGGTLDSVDMADGSPSSSDSSTQVIPEKSQGAAMHVTMDDPILRKKMTLKQLSSEAARAPAPESKPNTSSNSAMKRNISAMSRMGTSESDNSETEAVGSGSGSDEGYNASSERQSGSGSDDGDSSEGDAKKVKVASSAVSDKVGVTVGGSQSNSKRTETSSMSSSVLAYFSSVMNEEGTIELNSPSRPDSPRSNSSLSNDGNDMYDANAALEKMNETQIKSDGAARSKRDAAHLAAHLAATSVSTNKFRKRSKSEEKLASIVHQHPMKSGMSIMEKSLQQKLRSGNHHHYHSQSTGRKMLEKSFLSARRDLSSEAESVSVMSTMKLSMGKKIKCGDQLMKDSASDVYQEPSIYSLGQDIMANVVSYLDPPETHVFLTTPLSKAWLVTYTAPQELWKILCTSKPFYAKLDENECSSDSSTASFPICNDLEMRHLFGRYRLLYSSFVRCMKYLKRLQDDALNGRTPPVINSNQGDIYPFNKNTSLKAYFAKARRLRRSHRPTDGSRSSSDAALSITSPDSGSNGSNEKGKAGQKRGSGAARSGKSASANGSRQNNSSSRRLGRSMLTDRLLRRHVNLPWSCAIYSVVNWMVAFADVEGIQIMCLKCLPYLLEDESQRTTAQRAGLTDSVLRAMVLFPDSIELHTVAFHTLVLLARPLGGNEGMLFHTAMVNTRGIFNNGSSNSKNGIVIMLDSMRRFAHDEILQAMSCWSLVNVALTPLQKSMLVKLGGLTVTSNAMLQHPFNVEVQFRALFALINLVIPTETRPDETEEMREFEREIFEQLGEAGETSEKEMLDASVGQISNLVVVSMKNFCSSEAILNRACLVLHNLSLNEEYHSILLWTPNCYQMLEWCLGNYPHDHVLQQSAGGTIQRLNATLSSDEELRARFTHSIRAQQQHSLELARQEAVVLQEQQMMDVS